MSSMHTWMWIAWAVLILAPFVTAGLAWHFAILEGEHRGRCAERERQLERERRKAEARLGPPPGIRSKTSPRGFVSLPGPDLGHVSAADIGPVEVPGPYPRLAPSPLLSAFDVPHVWAGKPQPAPSPEPRTEGMPALTTTGEMRAATDEFIARLRSGETAWRAKGEAL